MSAQMGGIYSIVLQTTYETHPEPAKLRIVCFKGDIDGMDEKKCMPIN